MTVLAEHPADLAALETELLLEGLAQYYGDDFRGFARLPLQGRLHAFMQARGLPSVSSLQALVMHDQAAYRALCRTLYGESHALFAGPAQLLALRTLLRPWLRSCAAPKIWLAETTCAHEVFTLTVLLAEEGFYAGSLLFATGPDEQLLKAAQEEGVPAAELAAGQVNFSRSGGRGKLLDYLVEADGRLFLKPDLRTNLTWAQSSLATDSSFNEFQLIFCRQALADFAAPLRRRCLRVFADSLSPFGVLCVAPTDVLSHAEAGRDFRVQSEALGFYRRIGG